MALRAEGLVKSYAGRQVVKGVDFFVDRGETVGLLGPNGAGKTTTFYMMLGLVKADAGRVWLDDRDISAEPMHLRCRQGLGYLAQESSVFRKLSVRDNLLLILELQSLTNQEREERCARLLDKLRISHLAHQMGQSLSGGERRRVEIARALCTSPAFILLDEPFTGVDPIAIEDIRTIVGELISDDIGILITDHNVRDTLEITDRAYIISEGEIRTHGVAKDLPDDPIARQYYLGERFRM